jgi:predicted nucleic acid-binding protein
MKLLLDTNIVLDMLLGRGPWLAAASMIWQAGLDGRLTSYITASSLTDIYYIVRKTAGADENGDIRDWRAALPGGSRRRKDDISRFHVG